MGIPKPLNSDLFEKRGLVIAPQEDDAFVAACARANEAEASNLVAADPSVMVRIQSENLGLLADFAGAGNTPAVPFILDLGFDAAAARIKLKWAVGETALRVAAAHGRQSVAELLIERGAPLEARRHGGLTPLRGAVICLEQQSEWTPNEYTLRIAEALIKAGASLKEAGLTLTAAVCLGRRGHIAHLSPGASAEEKQKALAAAAYNARLDAMDTAIALGADPNARNAVLNPDSTALHNAVCSGSRTAVPKLVEAGASIDADQAYASQEARLDQPRT
jgi:ankyrin repeat protein